MFSLDYNFIFIYLFIYFPLIIKLGAREQCPHTTIKLWNHWKRLHQETAFEKSLKKRKSDN